MKKIIMVAALLCFGGLNARAASSFLGIDKQDVTIIDAQSDEININADGTLNSTSTLKGSGGAHITSEASAGGKEALHVVDLSKPNLNGLSTVYTSSNSMVVGGAGLPFVGLVRSISLLAIGSTCTFDFDGGDEIVLERNNGEDFSFGYTLASPTINLISKGGGATCKVRIIGAN